MNNSICIVLCSIACAAASCLPAVAASWNVRNIPLQRVSIVAHRGAGFLAPENTMEALELSWSMGAIPELDVRTTRDGKLMMFHDANFARILPEASDEMKKKRLEDLTYEEAKKLDIGAFRGKQFAGQRIVSLAEICAALKADPRRRAYIDVKNVDFKQMARETEGVHEQVILATGLEADCARWKAVAPTSDTFLWVGTWDDKDDTNVEKRFASLRKTGFANIDRLQVHCHFPQGPSGPMIPSDDFIRKAAEEVRGRGIEFQTMPWNIPESPEAYRRLLDLGTAGFGTDRPDVAKKALEDYYRGAPSGWNARDHIDLTDFVVQAHRGAGDLAPEGSLESFELGWSLGCIPEADLRQTKDGVIVSFHDNNLSRIVPGASDQMKRKGVEDLSFAEVEKLDIGRFRGPKFAGQKVISLADMVAVLKAHPDRKLYIDIKKVDFAKLARETRGVHRQLILASTKYDELKQWKAVAPASNTLHWMGGTQADLAKRLDALEAESYAGIDQLQIHVQTSPDGVFSPDEKFLTSAGERLRRRGILFQTFAWGQKDPKVIRRLLDLGCASFATDFPDSVMAAVRRYYNQPHTTR